MSDEKPTGRRGQMFSVRLSREELAKITLAAKEAGVSRSKFTRLAALNAIEHMRKQCPLSGISSSGALQRSVPPQPESSS